MKHFLGYARREDSPPADDPIDKALHAFELAGLSY